MAPKLLLLQARYPDDPAKNEEMESFVNKLQLPGERISSYDLLEGPPPLAELLSYDAIMMGGSGEFYVSKRNLPGFDELLHVLKEVT